MEFNLDNYPVGSKVAMRCLSEEKANKFLAFLEEKGVSWRSGDPPTSRNYYNEYEGEACYSFTEGIEYREIEFATADYYEDEGYTVLEFDDFDFEESNTEVPNELTAFLIGIMPA